MKKTILMTALLSINFLFAQELIQKPLRQWGVNFSVPVNTFTTNFKYNYYGFRFTPSITLTKGINQFELGSEFVLGSNNLIYKYKSLTFGYKRYFNGFDHRFNPYFYAGADVFSLNYRSIYYELASDSISYSGSSITRSLGLSLFTGFGLEMKLYKGFYLSSSVAISSGGVTNFNKSIDQFNQQHTSSNFRIMPIRLRANVQVGYRFGDNRVKQKTPTFD